MGEGNGEFLGVFADNLAPRGQPHPVVSLGLHAEIDSLDITAVQHWKHILFLSTNTTQAWQYFGGKTAKAGTKKMALMPSSL